MERVAGGKRTGSSECEPPLPPIRTDPLRRLIREPSIDPPELPATESFSLPSTQRSIVSPRTGIRPHSGCYSQQQLSSSPRASHFSYRPAGCQVPARSRLLPSLGHPLGHPKRSNSPASCVFGKVTFALKNTRPYTTLAWNKPPAPTPRRSPVGPPRQFLRPGNRQLDANHAPCSEAAKTAVESVPSLSPWLFQNSPEKTQRRRSL
jgi:hypothetical protein